MTAPASPFDLTGQVAVVTGGSKGLGAAAAAALAAAGAQLALVARDLTGLEAQARVLREGGAAVLCVTGDIGAPGEADRILDRAAAETGRLDILVNAAGAMTRGAVADTTPEEFQRVMTANAFGLWAMCRAAARHMTSGGSIVNLASTAGLIGSTDRSAYAASKGAAVQITRALAVELAPRNIRVNAVAPGPFATDMSQDMQGSERWRRLIGDRVPLGRIARPSEIGPPILFLASPGASFITGVILPVDGGWTAS